MSMIKFRWLAAMTLLAAASANCSSPEPEASSAPAASVGGEATPAEAVAPTPEQVAAIPPAALSDAEIAKITDSVDSAEIEQANVASSRAKHESVKQFAQHMIAQHTAAKQKGADLVHAKNVTPVTSTVSSNLQREGMQMLQTLKAADLAAFDATYIAGQIEEHQQVLQLLNSQLIPSATDAQLRALLTDAHAMVERHIAEAKAIQQSLASE
jgi:putative membrane protein